MIRALEVMDFRGVAKGRIEGLAPLTVFTGANGAGKSTVLEALLLATSPNPGEALGFAVSRRRWLQDGAKWLVREGRPSPVRATLAVERHESGTQTCYITWSRDLRPEFESALSRSGFRPPYSQAWHAFTAEDGSEAISDQVAFGADNRFLAYTQSRKYQAPLQYARLIDSTTVLPLDRTYSAAVRRGTQEHFLALLKAAVPDFEDIQLLTGEDGALELTLQQGGQRSPVGLAGDGVLALVRLSLEVAAAPGGLVLLEEPELHHHPRTLRSTARALVAAVGRGIQVVLTTHSMELVDRILDELTADREQDLAVMPMRLQDGAWHHGRIAGSDVRHARLALEEDLR